MYRGRTPEETLPATIRGVTGERLKSTGSAFEEFPRESSKRRLARPPLRFTPARGLQSPFLQTCLGALWPAPENPLAVARLAVETLPLEVGQGDLVLTQVRASAQGDVVYLLPGFGGNAATPLMRALGDALLQREYTLVVMHGRGAGLGRGLARLPYHAGTRDDIERLLQYGRKRWPGRRHCAVGVSLGGGILLSAMGQARGPLFDAAVALHPPVDLGHTVERLESGAGRIYGHYFAQVLRRAHAARVAAGLLTEPLRLPWMAGVRAIDSHWTAPAAGYSSAEAYYAACSSRPHLRTIRTPTVILTSLDDPIAAAADITTADRAACVAVHLEPTGGHAGYVARSRGCFPERWLPQAVVHYVAALLERLPRAALAAQQAIS